LRKAARQLSRAQVSQTASFPAPIGGWNDRDAYAEMDPKDAVILDNYFPLPSEVMLRYGYTNWVTGISGTVNTLALYDNGTVNKMFGAAGANIYDVTSSGAVGAAVVSAMTSDKWISSMFSTAGGQFLVMANGLDPVQEYNGTVWSVPVITNVSSSALNYVLPFKNRLWFIEKNSLRAWYLPTSSIAGAANSIDFSGLFSSGGSLVAMGDWTLDAGQGMDDYMVFITSEGQVAVYKGTDPAVAANWVLVGVYSIGTPVGRRCLAKYAGDLLLISKDGIFPLSKYLMSSRVNTNIAITDKIMNTVSTSTSDYANNFGWEIDLYPPENMLIINVPVSTTVSYQYVMNTISQAWCRFTGWNASTFLLFKDRLYFGTTGGVCRAWDGQSDNGTNINGEALQAFNYFGQSGQLKEWTMARPVLSADTLPGILLNINVDFDKSAPIGTPTFTPNMNSLWGTAIWGVDTWSGNLTIYKNWQSVFGIGYCAAMHMKTASLNSKCRWSATDYVYRHGGVL
jgi:hypothetical protein